MGTRWDLLRLRGVAASLSLSALRVGVNKPPGGALEPRCLSQSRDSQTGKVGRRHVFER